MTQRPTPQPFRVAIAPKAQQQFDLLPPRAARAAYSFLRTTMREDPEGQGDRLRGPHMKSYFLTRRADFKIAYTVDHVRRTVSILWIESR